MTYLQSRDRYILRNDTLSGQLIAINPNTLQPVPQGLSTDGSGQGFNAPAVIWIALVLAVGVSLSFVGLRGLRLTSGVGVGLVVILPVWASFVNTMGAEGISDLLLTLLCLAMFAVGFTFGFFEIGKWTGMVSLGISGGLSLGIRLMLFRSGLLFPVGDNGYGSGYVLGWVMITILGVLGGLWIGLTKYQINRLVFACTATGSFLVALGIDLALNRQNGMSRGLIFLFDRNSSHIVDVMTKGYEPLISTQVILGLSLGFVPLLSLAQYRLFREILDRGRPKSDSGTVLNTQMGVSASSRMSWITHALSRER